MRTLCTLFSVLLVSGMAMAADTTTAQPSTVSPEPAAAVAPEKAAPAPAAEEAPAPAPVTETPAAEKETKVGHAPAPASKAAATPSKECKAPAGPNLTWSGLAMFRLREEIVTNYRTTGVREEKATYSNQIAYHLGVKAKPNDQVLLQFDIGNDWYATEEVEGLPGNYWTKRNPMTPWFDLAYAQWDPGFMHIQAGIIPVAGTPLMDLLGVSIFFGRDYKNAAHIPWGVVTNFSQTGLRIGAPIVNKGPVSFGVDVMSAVLEMRQIGTGLDTMKLNPLAVEFELEAPLTISRFSLLPQAFITPNRSYNLATGGSDIEFGAGFNLGYKLDKGISFRAGFGYARNSNRNSYGKNNVIFDSYGDPFSVVSAPTDSVNIVHDSVKFDRWGTNLNVGTTVALGPGKLDFDFNLSNEQDMYNANVDNWFPFFDLKYGWALNKHFIVMPRVRLFFTEPKKGYNNQCKTRPEIIFTGVF
jgi:hypothetical protein